MASKKGRAAIIAAVSFMAVAIFWVANQIFLSGSQTSTAPSVDQDIASPNTPQPLPVKLNQSVHPDIPLEIHVSDLGIREKVRSVGLNNKGEMAEPDSGNEVVWYRPGFLPGAPGNAVFAGHSDYKGGQGVFYNLGKLDVGGTVNVLTANHEMTFTVIEKKNYQNGDVAPELFGHSEAPRLNLITCSGNWDPESKRYSERLVIVAAFATEKAL